MKTIKNFIKKYFSSFAYFYGYLSHRIFVMLFLSILIGVLDGLGLIMFLPLLQMTDGVSNHTADNLGGMGFIISTLEGVGLELNIRIALLLMFLFFILKGIISFYSLRYNVKIQQIFISSLRFKLTDLFTKYSYKHFVSADVGRIQNAFTAEISRVGIAYKGYLDSIQNLILVVVYTTFVFLIDWKFGLLVCVGGAGTSFLFRLFFKKTEQKSNEFTHSANTYTGAAMEYIYNFKYLKATGYLQAYASKLKKKISVVEGNNRQIGFLGAAVTAIKEPLAVGVVCLVVLLQVELIGGGVASILISLLFFYRALSSLMSFQNSYNDFLSVSGSLKNIITIEKELLENSDQKGIHIFNSFKDRISFKNVDYGYKESNGILKNLNIEILKNQTIAFVGESGSGKTTLVNLISGLLQANKGEVNIDGISFEELDFSSYQSKIGYIAQEPVIFNDSIFNNVTLWSEPTPENIDKFQDALKKASLLSFIERLPDKGETLLGNSGVNLSGGQKQRVSIARELFKDIDILILDEATSALDSETEKEIQVNIDEIKGRYTILIIAHRLSTIKNVDKIYLMDNGQIVGEGSFDDLINSNLRFKRMVELQDV
ncbi:ABC transporter ATP-binding protein [Brumimicrobium oceani]|uniref:ABC transporter ATP-binding protein n=1 Tax=Brumimicrobium oceani TaxID=2100725 RepID=A0A2U2XC02_9FLAO|nr:ABC transporter ATP-binding protein [Brumimicrobium oceani]PWH85325.1 ABC transporter ATP-binding protein [Brumimicrobium oceani]